MRNIFETESIGGLGVINERFPYIQYLTSKKKCIIHLCSIIRAYICVLLAINKQW